MIANYHTHTFRNRHGTGTEREYVEQAILIGLKTLGFSEHAPYRFTNDYSSWFHLQPDEAEAYVNAVLELQQEYKDDIHILLGFEAEYYPDLFANLLSDLHQYPVDYLVFGQHTLNNEFDGHNNHEPTDSEQLLNDYVNQCITGLETGVFSYLAHPDLFNFVGSDEVYIKHMMRICQYSLDHNIPLEVNLLGLTSGRCYPSHRFFSLAVSCGCSFIAGLDAHSPAAVFQPETLPAYEQFLSENKIKVLPELALRRPF